MSYTHEEVRSIVLSYAAACVTKQREVVDLQDEVKRKEKALKTARDESARWRRTYERCLSKLEEVVAAKAAAESALEQARQRRPVKASIDESFEATLRRLLDDKVPVDEGVQVLEDLFERALEKALRESLALLMAGKGTPQ